MWGKIEFLALKAGGMLTVPEIRAVRKICGWKKKKYNINRFIVSTRY